MTSDNNYKRIACEEALFPQEVYKLYLEEIKKNPPDEPGFMALMGFFLVSEDPYPLNVRERLLDLGERRLQDMDVCGIDKQLIFLTAPGVQIFDAATANSLAVLSNDQLAAACQKYPERFSGLAAVAPQDPPAAARELERAVTNLGLKGAVINSHTKGEYLDDPRFWEIFEAAETNVKSDHFYQASQILNQGVYGDERVLNHPSMSRAESAGLLSLIRDLERISIPESLHNWFEEIFHHRTAT